MQANNNITSTTARPSVGADDDIFGLDTMRLDLPAFVGTCSSASPKRASVANRTATQDRRLARLAGTKPAPRLLAPLAAIGPVLQPFRRSP